MGSIAAKICVGLTPGQQVERQVILPVKLVIRGSSTYKKGNMLPINEK